MGLDIVEFVMGVEDAVGVIIPNDDFKSIATPRSLVDYLHALLPQSREPRCLSQRAFYSIRQALADRAGVARSDLRPDTELLAVLPPPDPQMTWAEIGAAVGDRRWPPARGNSWWARTFLSDRPRTLGDAARRLATMSPRAVKPAEEGWSWAEVAAVVDAQIRHHFNIQTYSLDDRFVEDLGIA
jgi:hypothetical protein